MSNILLLLPPTQELTISAFRSSYEAAWRHVEEEVADERSSRAPTLITVVFVLPYQLPDTSCPRSQSYGYCQRVLALLYRLHGVVTAEKSDLRDEGDSKIQILLTYAISKHANELIHSQGPMVGLDALAVRLPSQQAVYAMDAPHLDSLISELEHWWQSAPAWHGKSIPKIKRLASGPEVSFSSTYTPWSLELDAAARSGPNRERHMSVAVGGTFDHLHDGHKLLLTATALILEPAQTADPAKPRCLTVGITGDELLKNKKYATVMESWHERQKSVVDFLGRVLNVSASGHDHSAEGYSTEKHSTEEHSTRKNSTKEHATMSANPKVVCQRMGYGLTVRCVELSDPMGPTITDESITALVLSGETRSGGQAVNDKRREKQWPELEVFEVDVLGSGLEDTAGVEDSAKYQSKISSTAIRQKIVEATH